MDKGWMDTKQAAEYVGCSEAHLARECSAKNVTYYKPGKERRFRVEDLDQYLETKKIEARA